MTWGHQSCLQGLFSIGKDRIHKSPHPSLSRSLGISFRQQDKNAFRGKGEPRLVPVAKAKPCVSKALSKPKTRGHTSRNMTPRVPNTRKQTRLLHPRCSAMPATVPALTRWRQARRMLGDQVTPSPTAARNRTLQPYRIWAAAHDSEP